MSKYVKHMNRKTVKNKIRNKMQEKQREGFNELIKEGIDQKELEGFSSAPLIQDNLMVRWKSSRTEFIKMFKEYCKQIIRERKVDITEYGFLMALSLFLDYEDNKLVNEEGFPFSFNEILEFTGMEKTKATRIMKKLVEIELLYKLPHHKDKRKFIYYINPNVVYMGVKIDKNTREQFKIKKNK